MGLYINHYSSTTIKSNTSKFVQLELIVNKSPGMRLYKLCRVVAL